MGMIRGVTLIRIEIVINGRRNVYVAQNRADIIELLTEDLPIKDYLREMADEILDGGDTIDDGSGWTQGEM